MSRMDSKRWIPVSQIFIYTEEEDPVTTKYMGYTQNIYNKTQEQHTPANIYTDQHKTNIVIQKIPLADV